jgi:hypothetical protein
MTFVDKEDNRVRKEYSTRTRSLVRFVVKGNRNRLRHLAYDLLLAVRDGICLQDQLF